MSKKRQRQLPNRFSKTRPKRPISTQTDSGSIVPNKPADKEAPKPNILFIMVDQMRFPRFSYGSDHGFVDPMKQILGFQGNADEENEFRRFFPGFWGLRDNAVVLNNHHTASSACVPSRAVMMTGQYGTVTGVKYTDGTLKDGLDEQFPWLDGKKFATLGDWMREAGYSTHYFGKWHCNGKFNSPEQPQPGDHGFDEWFSTQNNAAPSHENPKNFVRNGSPVGPLEGYACRLVAGEAIDWLEERPSPENPFFLFVCFHEPHEPVASPKELTDSYPEAKKRGEALYYANVTNMDRAVGDLMRALDEQGLTENTLVFFTSDNGPETLNRYGSAWRSHGSPGPLRGMKLWLYEGGIRVPGIVRWPARVEPGQTTNTPVCGLDVFPTFCELAGLPVPDDRPLDGSSVVGLLDGEPVERETPLYWHYYSATDDAKCAMRVGDWMILGHWDGPQFTPGGQFRRAAAAEIRKAELTSFELYNVQRDPAQKMNLAAEEPERLRRLSAMLVKKYREIRDDGPDWGPSTQR